jgi:hypothetical protein
MRKALMPAVCLVWATSWAHAQGPTGPEFRVNASTTRWLGSPAVALTSTGGLLVAWQDDSFILGQPHVQARVIDARGVPLGPQFQVDTGDVAFGPSAAAVAAGGFVVVWNDITSSTVGVTGRVLDASGAPVGAEFRADDSSSSSDPAAPRVAAAPDGSLFVVAWSDRDADSRGVAARRYSPTGVPLGPQFQVNTYTTGVQGVSYFPPGIAVAENGAFVVVWVSDEQDGSDRGVFGQLFDANGARVGGEFQANSYTTAGQFHPTAGFDASGEFVVAWMAYEAGAPGHVAARRFNAAGQPVGDEYRATPPGPSAADPVVVPTAAGHAVVWRNEGAPLFVSGRHFGAGGTPQGREFHLNSRTAALAHEFAPSVWAVGDGDGGFAAAWSTPAGTVAAPNASDIMARRYAAVAPQPSAMDAAAGAASDGNGVLEAGETVVFAPSWRNFHLAPVTLDGDASGFTGPGGALYSIPDATASYGSVPAGGAASCTGAGADCYVLAVAAPNSRPAPHWDASFDEQLSSGQPQRWTVHVGESFADVPRSHLFYPFVETLLHRGVTSGCAAGTFCPADSTTRAQLSPFVLLAREGAGYLPLACSGASRFPDVPAASPFCPWIEELARRGVVAGCGGGNFCPGTAVTRGESAVFVLATLDPTFTPPPCGTPVFSDVPAASPFCPFVEELARRGVVAGCAPGLFCPGDPVTRGQMAVFLSGGFGLTLYGP